MTCSWWNDFLEGWKYTISIYSINLLINVQAGNVVGSGEPKTVDYKNLLQEANTAAVNLQENSTTLPDMNKAVDGEINSKDSKNNFTLDEDF